jgi:hypothetical protein
LPIFMVLRPDAWPGSRTRYFVNFLSLLSQSASSFLFRSSRTLSGYKRLLTGGLVGSRFNRFVEITQGAIEIGRFEAVFCIGKMLIDVGYGWRIGTRQKQNGNCEYSDFEKGPRAVRHLCFSSLKTVQVGAHLNVILSPPRSPSQWSGTHLADWSGS